MRICIIGSGLTSLALAKALVNQNINVDILRDKKKQKIETSPHPRHVLRKRCNKKFRPAVASKNYLNLLKRALRN